MFEIVQASWLGGLWTVFTLLIVMIVVLTALFVGIKIHRYMQG